MEKQKLLVSFVEKVPPVQLKNNFNKPSSLLAAGGFFALSTDGKRLVRLQPADLKKSEQLIGVLTEKNESESSSPSSSSSTASCCRRQVRIEPKSKNNQQSIAVEVTEPSDENALEGVKTSCVDGINQKIPRPANAFMLFANEWRKKLAVENPRESNKDISVRLGVLWKTMPKDVKEKYFALARQVDAEHKKKYPDYVYNPKEARLRKAMREQSREQSRTNPSSSILGRQPLSGNSTVGAGSNRIIVPWSFPLGNGATGAAAPPQPTLPPPPPTHPTKPILSPRVMVQQHNSKEPTAAGLRKQLESCSAGFAGAGYPQHQDYGHHAPAPRQEGEYCDFAEGQKWHPYQNGMNPAAYHSRSALMSKMNSLHRGMQSAMVNSQPAVAHSAWGQFCNVPYSPSQSAMMRSRQMVFLQEQQNQQQQSQHCAGGGYPPEMQMSYEAKMQDDLNRRLHSSYSQPEHQVKSSPTTATAGLQQQQQHLTHQQDESSKSISDSIREEDGPRWSAGDSGGIIDRPSSVSSSSCATDSFFDSEPQPPSTLPGISKTPLPGFQQAFGSTEIGKFSRSELFASLVKAANLIPSDGILKSRSKYPTAQSVEPLHKLRREDFKKQLFIQNCNWIDVIKANGFKIEELSTMTKIQEKLRNNKMITKAQQWPCTRKLPPPALGHRRNCECSSFTLPSDSKLKKLDNDENNSDLMGLDLRVPSRKKFKEDLTLEYADSSVDANFQEKTYSNILNC